MENKGVPAAERRAAIARAERRLTARRRPLRTVAVAHPQKTLESRMLAPRFGKGTPFEISYNFFQFSDATF